MMRKVEFWLCLLIGVIYFSCSSGTKHVQMESTLAMPSEAFIVPAGVDSATAIRADSLADSLFVSFKREEKADSLKHVGARFIEESDSLWQYLTMKVGEKIVSHEDSVAFNKAFNQGALSLKELAAILKKVPGDTAESAQLMNQQGILLDKAQKSFELAIRLNPFDNDARSYLAIVYKLQAKRLGKENNYKKVAQILERLTRLIKGEHKLFARLGETYFALKQWEKSQKAFANAENVLLATSGLRASVDTAASAAIDTAAWFQYAYYQGYNATNLRHAPQALEKLHQAEKLAPDESSRENVQSVIEWINWDDGNIAASEEKDRIIELEDQKQFATAEKAYAALLANLKTQRAKDEIEWRLALLEFNSQTQDKKEQAVRRLQKVVERLESMNVPTSDSLSIPPGPSSQVYPDSLKTPYYDAYGKMLYNLGVEYVNGKSRKRAFTYFLKAANLVWNGQAKALLQAGIFAQNAPRKAIQFCEQAYALRNQLTKNELKKTLSLLTQLYKQIGDFEKARQYYQLWTGK